MIRAHDGGEPAVRLQFYSQWFTSLKKNRKSEIPGCWYNIDKNTTYTSWLFLARSFFMNGLPPFSMTWCSIHNEILLNPSYWGEYCKIRQTRSFPIQSREGRFEFFRQRRPTRGPGRPALSSLTFRMLNNTQSCVTELPRVPKTRQFLTLYCSPFCQTW